MSASVLVLAVFGSPLTGQVPSPDQLISSYEKALQRFQRLSFVAKVKQTHEGPTMPQGTVLEESTHRVIRNNDSWWHSVSSVNSAIVNGQKHTQLTECEFIYEPSGLKALFLNPTTRKPDTIRARLTEPTAEQAKRAYMGYAYTAYVTGHIPLQGYHSVPEILKLQESKSIQLEEDSGRRLVRLHTTGDWGDLTCWFGPTTQPTLPVRLRATKRVGKDWIAEGKPKPKFKGDGSWYPSLPLVLETREWNVLRTSEGTLPNVVTDFEVKEVYLFEDKSETVLLTRCNLMNLMFDPPIGADSFQFRTKIPDGTAVFVEEEHPIAYEWREGKIVKAIDGAAVKNLQGHRFLATDPSADRNRWLLIASAFVVLATAAMLWIRRRWLVRVHK